MNKNMKGGFVLGEENNNNKEQVNKGLGKKFDLSRVLEKTGIDRRYVDNSSCITENQLKEVFDDFVKANQEFNELYEVEFKKLISGIEGVHSISGRIKDPDHLIGKIIRNVAEKPSKYSVINEANYYQLITDLVGFRIIVLDKNDWSKVHDSLEKLYINDPTLYIASDEGKSYLDKYKEGLGKKAYYAEQPKVYLTEVDEGDEILYKKKNIKVDRSKNNYRSVHYIIRNGKFYFEIQVRSLFEEGWLEFEHRVSYPNDRKNAVKQQYVAILNNLARAADGIITFYDNYYDFIDKHLPKDQDTLITTEVEEPDIDSDDYVDQLSLS